MSITNSAGAVDLSKMVSKEPAANDTGVAATGLVVSLVDALTISVPMNDQAKKINEIRTCLREHGLMK